MTLTEVQVGVLVGLLASTLLVLACLVFHLHRLVKFYRRRAAEARTMAQQSEYEKLVLKQEFDTLVFMRDRVDSEELTPDEIDYLHRTLGISIPAQRSNSDGSPSIPKV